MPSSDEPNGPGSAFLLAQLGAWAAAGFAERIGELGLTPPQTGLLRAVALSPGRSQQALAEHLGTPPSRLVALVDGLEDRGLIERRRNTGDRRLHALHVTVAGTALLRQVGRVAAAHDDAVCAGLDDAARATLRETLGRLAAQHGLTPGVHPGYRRL